jgi:23S rRNA (cytosine1962-C5)-methyltransferase
LKRVTVSNRAKNLLKEGFLWVYSSEVKEKIDSVEFVRIYDNRDRFLGIGYINLRSKIAVRVLTFKDEEINREFFKKRILEAYQFKKDISEAIRLIHSEGDMLSGLFIDKFKNHFSIIFTTAGSLLFKDEILSIIKELFRVDGYLLRFEEKYSKIEGVEPFSEVEGDIENISFQENGIEYRVNLIEGQKSGFYLDQRRNRAIVSQYIKQGDRALDLFSNSGGFGLYFAKRGAEVTLVDISNKAIEQAKENFKLNNLTGKFVVANSFDYLRELRKSGAKFDFINIDPPSFAKSKREVKNALNGFRDLLINSIRLIENGGLIAIYSCSYNVSQTDLEEISKSAQADTKSRLIILETLLADIDHTQLLSMEPTRYLKGLLFKVYKQ